MCVLCERCVSHNIFAVISKVIRFRARCRGSVGRFIHQNLRLHLVQCAVAKKKELDSLVLAAVSGEGPFRRLPRQSNRQLLHTQNALAVLLLAAGALVVMFIVAALVALVALPRSPLLLLQPSPC